VTWYVLWTQKDLNRARTSAHQYFPSKVYTRPQPVSTIWSVQQTNRVSEFKEGSPKKKSVLQSMIRKLSRTWLYFLFSKLTFILMWHFLNPLMTFSWNTNRQKESDNVNSILSFIKYATLEGRTEGPSQPTEQYRTIVLKASPLGLLPLSFLSRKFSFTWS
jgi:hypothetical protein